MTAATNKAAAQARRMDLQIRFCSGYDGTRLAYTTTGSGAPLVRAPHWLTHLEYESQSPVWIPWMEALSRNHSLLRMDERGCGLSEWNAAEITFESLVRDLASVVDAAGLERFALFGHSQGAAISLEYAARNPERVSHLIILGGFMRGSLAREPDQHVRAEVEALRTLIEVGWGRDDPSYRQLFSMQFMPGGTQEQIKAFSELQRLSATPENAIRIFNCIASLDVRKAAAQVQCPTLILHSRFDRRIPLEEARQMATVIPNARLITLESENHVLLPQEPSFRQFFEQLDNFVAHGPDLAGKDVFPDLTPREAEVLERIAQGLDNAQIAAHLGLAEKTVRNNITRIFDKLGVENRSQTIVLARNRGMGLGKN